MDHFNWINGLDRTGWVAVTLFVVFFIITAFTIVIMLKINAENKKARNKKPLKKPQPTALKPVWPTPEKPEVKTTEKKNDDSNPLEEAKVFLTYGLNKQAADLLEKYLKKNPSDKTAQEMLIKAHSSTQ